VPHPSLGEAVVAVVTARGDHDAPDLGSLQTICREKLPAYMVPATIELRAAPLPRNANGKIDRKAIASDYRMAAARQVMT